MATMEEEKREADQRPPDAEEADAEEADAEEADAEEADAEEADAEEADQRPPDAEEADAEEADAEEADAEEADAEEADAEETWSFERQPVTCQPPDWQNDTEEPMTFEREALTVNQTASVTFEKDQFGNLRCKDYRAHHVSKGKIVLMNETEAWRVTRRMTAKEQRTGTYNPEYPLGPYVCPSHRHYHIGHDSSNVGRKPSRMIRFQLWVDGTGKQVAKIKRQIRNRLIYWHKRFNGLENNG